MSAIEISGVRYVVWVTLGKMRRCRSALGIDLLHPEKGQFADILNDYDSLVDVLLIFVERVGDGGTLSDEDAQTLMDDCTGKDVKTLTRALGGALADFFREDDKPEIAEQIDGIFETMVQAREKLAQKIREVDVAASTMQKLDTVDLSKILDEVSIDGQK